MSFGRLNMKSYLSHRQNNLSRMSDIMFLQPWPKRILDWLRNQISPLKIDTYLNLCGSLLENVSACMQTRWRSKAYITKEKQLDMCTTQEVLYSACNFLWQAFVCIALMCTILKCKLYTRIFLETSKHYCNSDIHKGLAWMSSIFIHHE